MNTLHRVVLNLSIQKSSKYYSTITSIATKNALKHPVSYTDNYTLDQHNYILNMINQNNGENLGRYRISKQRLLMLKSQLKKNGPFESIQDLLKVSTMNERLLQRLCDSILTDGKPILKNLIFPTLNAEKRMQINTVLNVHIGINAISWTLMNRQLQVLEWNYKTYENINGKKNVLEQMKQVMDIIACLPESDAYVIEDSKISVPKNINHLGMYFLLLKSRVYSMIIFHLANRKSSPTTPLDTNLYVLNTKELGTYFDLNIGSEMKACSKKLEELMNETCTETPISGITIDKELKVYYKSCSITEQEQMSFSLLASLIFLEVEVLKKNCIKLSN